LFHARRQCQSPELILIRQGYWYLYSLL
jgi:hypothetical protein